MGWPRVGRCAVLALLMMAMPQIVLAEDAVNRAALVVRFADDRVETPCVPFEEPAITGEELLARSGLAPIVIDYGSGQGGAVCRIASSGCDYPRDDCFCHCTGTECNYWAYYHGTAAGWQYSQTGAGSHQVVDGALEGWSWGAGNFAAATEPPAITFEEVCGSGADLPGAEMAEVPMTAADGLPGATAAPRAASGEPILPGSSVQLTVSLADAGPAAADAGELSDGVPDRHFQAELLWKYALYLISVALLLVAALLVIRRPARRGD